MPNSLTVGHYKRLQQGDTSTVSAMIGDYEVWFRGRYLAKAPERGEAFLAVALMPAMYAGTDLDLRDMPPISTKLLGALDQIQEIWTTWNPAFSRIAVRANVATDESPISPRTATCFSGGVDAVYAVTAGAGPNELLALINGFDFFMSPADWAIATARAGRLATTLAAELATIETNWIQFTRHRRISRPASHGGCLFAVGQLLAPSRMTIASSNSWLRLTPYGTHNLVDRLWSTDLTTFRHFGSDALRSEKVAAIAAVPGVIEDLWVCHVNPVRNCGQCLKCSRTMAVLKVIGASTASFLDPGGDPIDRYLQAVPYSQEKVFLDELRRTVLQHGADPGLLRRIAAADRAISRRAALRGLRNLMLPRRPRTHQDVDVLPWGFDALPES
jgi:hypothetical protein